MKGRMCECTGKECGKHSGNCGEHPYSWSAEHGNKCLCVDCYENWLSRKASLSALQAVQTLKDNPEAMKLLKELLH